jgi:hypothetical protein
MTTSRLFDEREAIKRLSRSTRQSLQFGSSQRSLNKGAGPCGAEFDRRTQPTVFAPMTFIGTEALPDPTPVADEHLFFDPWHYHGPYWSRLHAERLAPSTHTDPDCGELPLPGMTSYPDSLLSITLRVDDGLRHLSSVEVVAFHQYNSHWRFN